MNRVGQIQILDNFWTRRIDPECENTHPEAEADQRGQVFERWISQASKQTPEMTRDHFNVEPLIFDLAGLSLGTCNYHSLASFHVRFKF